MAKRDVKLTVDPVGTPATRGKRTRGGHEPTGTSAARRVRSAKKAGPKGERTRAAIIAGGRVVFERMGYVDARVSDIVKAAGVAHGSFYTYFPSKREVFQEIVRDVGEQIAAAVTRRPEDMPGETVRNLNNANRRYLDVHRRNAKFMALFDQVATIDPVIHKVRIDGRRRHVDRVAGTIVRLQEHGIADQSVDASAAALVLVSMLGAVAFWADALDYDEDRAMDAVTEVWVKTLGLEAPRPTSMDAPTKTVNPGRRRTSSTRLAG